MNLRKGLLSAAVAVAVVTGGVALAGTAHASISPTVEYTQKTAGTAVAGIFAHAPSSSVNFTHITAYVGNDGGSSQEQLAPVGAFGTGGNIPGGTVSGVVNGVGLGLCNQDYVAGPPGGYGVQLGQVYVGGGLVDIVYAGGLFGSPRNNNDPCQNGVVSSTAQILMANVPVNDTVELDILYDYAHNYFWHSRLHPAGTITFSGTDLSATPGTTVQSSFPAPAGLKFNEADAGAVADTTTVNPLQGSVPLPDVKFSPDLLATVAHLKLNGNVTGGHELFGPAWGNAVGWNSFYVAADKNGGMPSQGNPLYLAPGQVRSDHIRIYVGQPTG